MFILFSHFSISKVQFNVNVVYVLYLTRVSLSLNKIKLVFCYDPRLMDNLLCDLNYSISSIKKNLSELRFAAKYIENVGWF